MPATFYTDAGAGKFYISADADSTETEISVEETATEILVTETLIDVLTQLTIQTTHTFDGTGISGIHFIGSDGADTYNASTGDAFRFATINGKGGDDVLNGGVMGSRIIGGDGDDTITAGGSGSVASQGRQFVFGGDGDDTIQIGYQFGTEINYVAGGDGDDKVECGHFGKRPQSDDADAEDHPSQTECRQQKSA